MASEQGAPAVQHLHPASLLFAVARSARVFALPALLLLLSVDRPARGPGRVDPAPDNLELWLLLFLVPSVIVAVAKYVSFRLRYEDADLVIRSGLLFRNERHVPYARIQNLDAVQNIVHRMLDVVEVRVQTGGGREPEATIRVLPASAMVEMRRRVFEGRARASGEGQEGAESAPAASAREADVLLDLPVRELALCGFIENRGLVIVGAAYGILWELGLLDRFWDFASGERADAPRLVRGAVSLVRSGSLPSLRYVILALGGIAVFLVLVRILSMAWAVVRLYGFRLTRAGDDLRTEFGLLTREMSTIPLHKVQTLTIHEAPFHRLARRVAVGVETAGGGGQASAGGQQRSRERQWLAPIVRTSELQGLLEQVVPGFDPATLAWQPVDPRAFRRAVKPALARAALLPLLLAVPLGGWGLLALIVTVPLAVLNARKRVERLGWAATETLAVFRSGWFWRKVTVARAAKIQAVTLVESPFDRRTAMAQVRVDTAGAGERSHRVRIPYLARDVARDLHRRLSARAAGTVFRW